MRHLTRDSIGVLVVTSMAGAGIGFLFGSLLRDHLENKNVDDNYIIHEPSKKENSNDETSARQQTPETPEQTSEEPPFEIESAEEVGPSGASESAAEEVEQDETPSTDPTRPKSTPKTKAGLTLENLFELYGEDMEPFEMEAVADGLYDIDAFEEILRERNRVRFDLLFGNDMEAIDYQGRFPTGDNQDRPEENIYVDGINPKYSVRSIWFEPGDDTIDSSFDPEYRVDLVYSQEENVIHRYIPNTGQIVPYKPNQGKPNPLPEDIIETVIDRFEEGEADQVHVECEVEERLYVVTMMTAPNGGSELSPSERILNDDWNPDLKY